MTSTPYRDSDPDPLSAQIGNLIKTRDALLVKLGLVPEVDLYGEKITVCYQLNLKEIQSGISIFRGPGLYILAAEISAIQFSHITWQERDKFKGGIMQEWLKDESFQAESYGSILDIYFDVKAVCPSAGRINGIRSFDGDGWKLIFDPEPYPNVNGLIEVISCQVLQVALGSIVSP